MPSAAYLHLKPLRELAVTPDMPKMLLIRDFEPEELGFKEFSISDNHKGNKILHTQEMICLISQHLDITTPYRQETNMLCRKKIVKKITTVWEGTSYQYAC